MSRICTLLGSCGRGPVVALAIASAAAFGLGLVAAGHGVGNGRVITVQEGGNGQDGKKGQEGQDWGEMDPEAMMEMMAQLGAPDEHHKELAVFVGTWDTKMEAIDPGMEAFNTTGTATFESTMGGRFITQTFTGTMMDTPMTGVGISGYNKASKKYEALWHDNIGTAMYFLTGEKTDKGWTYEGTETDPMSGQTYGIRHVIEMDGKDKFTFTMQYPAEVAAQMGVQAKDGAKWVDSFRIHYTRKGAGGGNGLGGDRRGNGASGNRGR